jgi:hypothetical protein
MRRLAVLADLAVAAVSPAVAAATEPTDCDGEFTGTAESIVVHFEKVCTLSGATVTGDATAEPGGVLNIQSSTVAGDAIGQAGSLLRIDFSHIGGEVTSGAGASMGMHFSIVDGDVRALGATGVSSFDSTLGGDFVHTDGGGVIFQANEIASDVRIERNYGTEMGVASNDVGGRITFADNRLAPGGPQGYFEVRDNTVAKAVDFSGNLGPSTIFRNVVDGTLVCRDNFDPPAAAGNIAKKLKGSARPRARAPRLTSNPPATF